jgi:hypothetical protein
MHHASGSDVDSDVDSDVPATASADRGDCGEVSVSTSWRFSPHSSRL